MNKQTREDKKTSMRNSFTKTNVVLRFTLEDDHETDQNLLCGTKFDLGVLHLAQFFTIEKIICFFQDGEKPYNDPKTCWI